MGSRSCTVDRGESSGYRSTPVPGPRRTAASHGDLAIGHARTDVKVGTAVLRDDVLHSDLWRIKTRVHQDGTKLNRTFRWGLSKLRSTNTKDCHMPSAGRPPNTGRVIEGLTNAGRTWSAP